MDYFGLGLQLEYENLTPPREGDTCLMEEPIRLKVPKAMSTKVNRCRKRQEVMWISGILSASGDTIKSQYYSDWQDSREGLLVKHRSSLPFGQEYPSEEDWK